MNVQDYTSAYCVYRECDRHYLHAKGFASFTTNLALASFHPVESQAISQMNSTFPKKTQARDGIRVKRVLISLVEPAELEHGGFSLEGQ